MVEWDVQTELEKRDLISAAPHGGFLITEKGRAYVREMHN
jgi:Mn-dependent DtxR family transcriptional regulator